METEGRRPHAYFHNPSSPRINTKLTRGIYNRRSREIKINTTNSPASGADVTLRESARSHVRVGQCVLRGGPVFPTIVWLRKDGYRVCKTRAEGYHAKLRWLFECNPGINKGKFRSLSDRRIVCTSQYVINTRWHNSSRSHNQPYVDKWH